MENLKNQTNSFLAFKVDEEYFAIHVMHLRNILEYQSITKVPKSPNYMLGVINLRGQVLPVIDTRTVFSLPYQEPTANTCILVLEVEYNQEHIVVGALVDSVSEVLEINPADIKPAPTIGANYKTDFISGVYHDEDKFIMLLNVNKVLSLEELVGVKEASVQQELQTV